MGIEELLEEAEPVDRGVTNEVWFNEDEVIKKYSDNALLGSVLKAASLSRGMYEDLGAEARVQNERTAEQYFSGREISTPEILHTENYDGSEYVVFERIDGSSFGESVEEMDWDDVYEIATKVGESLSNLHEEGYARRDSRGENVIFTRDNGELDFHWIDNEYFTHDASRFDKYVDVNTFLGEADTYPPKKQLIVRKGFEKGYDKEVNGLNTVLSFPLAARLSIDDIGSGKGFNYLENVWNQLES